MLQNRVDPFGNIFKTEARGALMGNRGLLHTHQREIVRAYRLHAWITCKLEFKGRRREVMAPGLYTELFFLDEATSFAAGHRPCFECRRVEAEKFKTHWLAGNPEFHFHRKISIQQIDDILHRERISAQDRKMTYEADPASLPDGTFVALGDDAYLISCRQMHRWTPFGYDKKIQLPPDIPLTVLTPKSIVNAFRSGYSACMQLA
ncbi:MAG TPA: hypothetical protein VFZ52_01600 [Chryseolinea sp.]